MSLTNQLSSSGMSNQVENIDKLNSIVPRLGLAGSTIIFGNNEAGDNPMKLLR